MATLTPGDGGTIRSNTIEGVLQELCTYLQIYEFSALNNPNGLNNIIGNHLQDSKQFTCNYTIPVKQELNTLGQIVYSAIDYLADLIFVPGTGGTFKSTTCAGYLMEAIIYCQNLEQNAAKNPNRENNITGTFNSDSTTFSGTINLPVSVNISAIGEVTYKADEYLLT